MLCVSGSLFQEITIQEVQPEKSVPQGSGIQQDHIRLTRCGQGFDVIRSPPVPKTSALIQPVMISRGSLPEDSQGTVRGIEFHLEDLKTIRRVIYVQDKLLNVVAT